MFKTYLKNMRVFNMPTLVVSINSMILSLDRLTGGRGVNRRIQILLQISSTNLRGSLWAQKLSLSFSNTLWPFSPRVSFYFLDVTLVDHDCASGVAATFPLDLVKTNLQLNPKSYSGILDCFRKIHSFGGFTSFYRGTFATYSVLLLYLVDGRFMIKLDNNIGFS